MVREKIGIALSGGVDSTVSAALLQQIGYRVHGFFMRLPLAGADDQARRVEAVADRLGIPLVPIDMTDVFTDKVITYFLQTYFQGQTPNPCVICNRQVKFGALLDEMRRRGMELMATGHYARIEHRADGVPALRKGRDAVKDQSYFLCRLTRSQLERLVLPLGELTKNEVYQMAAKMGLSGIHGPESQDICFLAGRSVADFIADQGFAEQPGDIVTASGRVIGRHRGLWYYTIGQRRGLNLPDATPWYVGELDAASNRVVVCKQEHLLRTRVWITDVQWGRSTPALPWRGKVQIRGRHAPATASVSRAGDSWIIDFDAPQRAVTPGQYAVFYREDSVQGSGIITSRERYNEVDTQ